MQICKKKKKKKKRQFLDFLNKLFLFLFLAQSVVSCVSVWNQSCVLTLQHCLRNFFDFRFSFIYRKMNLTLKKNKIVSTNVFDLSHNVSKSLRQFKLKKLDWMLVSPGKAYYTY